MLKKRYKLIFIIAGIFFSWQLWQSFFSEKIDALKTQNFIVGESKINFSDSGFNFEVISKAKTVGEFFAEQKIVLSQDDVVFPDKSAKIFSGSRVVILRAKKIKIKEGGKTKEVYSLQSTVEQVIWEDKNIILGDDDITIPSRNTLIKEGMMITVVHVVIKEEIKNLDIDFKTVSNEDDELGWRIKKVTQKGVKGIKEVKYKVVYNDGKEISRKVLESNVTKDPIEEIVTQGTYVKLGKGARGDGTWYAFKGGLFAASRTIARGGYAKVTNMDNGQSVIVQINDYGPQAKERIIDLDKVAFAKIANLGQGVLHNVKVEQVLN